MTSRPEDFCRFYSTKCSVAPLSTSQGKVRLKVSFVVNLILLPFASYAIHSDIEPLVEVGVESILTFRPGLNED